MRQTGKLSLITLGVAVGLAGCADAPQRPARTVQHVAASQPARPSEVYVYPAQGQDERQLDRDRYECHRWAVRRSGHDPSQPGHSREYPAQVVHTGPPPGASVAAGAVTGAVLGASIAGYRDRGEGALIGAAAGAVLGAAVETSRAEQARSSARYYATEQDSQSGGYVRAITACLEGRGYAVR